MGNIQKQKGQCCCLIQVKNFAVASSFVYGRVEELAVCRVSVSSARRNGDEKAYL
jgi:hypothetical protein